MKARVVEYDAENLPPKDDQHKALMDSLKELALEIIQLSPNIPSEAGFAIKKRSASAFNVKENPEFAKLFYSTALTAQASGRNVTIQMRGSQSGYLKFDRIWLAAPK